MYLYPAIDLYGGSAVRLYRGDYARMTVYSHDPAQVAERFAAAGAERLHLVDLEGAKTGIPANLPTVERILKTASFFTELGGGIRSMEAVERCLSIGIDRVILGTAAVTDYAFLEKALARFGSRIAVGVDLKDGYAAIRGWTETSGLTAEAFFDRMQSSGVATVICTDISRDGCLKGTNRALYRRLSQTYSIDLIASGGVSTLEDVAALRDMKLHGAILGKALYTGAVDLKTALEVAK